MDFDLVVIGAGPGAPDLITVRGLRYGRGLYFSATSGKSNDYAHGSERVRAAR